MVDKAERDSKILTAYRQPIDTTALVDKTRECLHELKKVISSAVDDVDSNISIDAIKVKDIVQSLNELNSERLWLHDAVETETITASILRHKLGGFSKDIKAEIRDAVRSAKDSNAMIINSYKEKLHATEMHIQELQNKYELLSVSNISLLPEKEELKEKHQGVVAILNKTLLDKASMQIYLNETREKLRDTNVRIKDFEEAFFELSEDMKAEREETAIEKKRLRGEIKEAHSKIETQRQLNLVKKSEVEKIQEKQALHQSEVERKKEDVLYHDSNLQRLKELYQSQTQQLEVNKIKNAELVEKSKVLEAALQEMISNYNGEKERFDKELSSIVSAIQLAQKELSQLQSQKVKSMNALDTALVSGRKDKDEADEAQKNLRAVKDDLLSHTSECTRLTRESGEMQLVIDTKMQDHIAATDMLQKVIKDHQEKLEDLRKERQVLQCKRDQTNREASDYMNEFNKFVMCTSRAINEGKIQHSKQNEKGKVLQNVYKETEKKLNEKESELEKLRKRSEEMMKDASKKMNAIRENISKLKVQIETSSKKYEKDLPAFEDLKGIYGRKAEDFENMKKFVVEVKKRKVDLEATVESKQSTLDHMETPKLEVQNHLADARSKFVKQLKEEATEVQMVESKVFDISQKNDAIQKQNNRFIEAINFFKSDIEFMSNRMKAMHDGKFSIDISIGEYTDWLELQWRKHMELDKKYYAQDILLLDDIQKVERITSQREKKVEEIHARLERELDLLTQFIGKVAVLKEGS